MLRVVEDQFQNDSQVQCTVVVEGDVGEFEKLRSKEAREMAMKYARDKNFPVRGFSGTTSPYPVDSTGQPSDDVVHGRTPVKALRIDITLSSGLGSY